MQEFIEFNLGARVIFNAGVARELGPLVEECGGQRVFVVADKGVVNAGLLAPVLAGLQGCVVGVFDAVPPNSSLNAVQQGTAAAREAGADLIIAVGGGSPIDTAKGMRILLTLGGELTDYEGYNVINQRLTPLIVLPTTAGTGSEVTPYAVIKDEAAGRKISGIVSRFVVPDMAVLDPELTRSLPPTLTAATGMDALSHAIEAYVSTNNNPFSDSMALYAIDLIATHLRTAVRQGDNLEARGHMLIASCMAGIACSSTLFGVVHAISHTAGGMFPIHHGTLNSIALPLSMAFNSPAVPERYVRIARALGINEHGLSPEEVIAAGVSAVATLAVDCGLPTRLRDVGVPETALPELAALSLHDGTMLTNPRAATEEELLALVRGMW